MTNQTTIKHLNSIVKIDIDRVFIDNKILEKYAMCSPIRLDESHLLIPNGI